jgi:hypothetical protein
VSSRWPLHASSTLAAVSLSLACDKPVQPRPFLVQPDQQGHLANPTPPCGDFAPNLYVCWSADGTPVSATETAIELTLSDLGNRCAAKKGTRRCVDRGRNAEPFRCEGTRCVQRHPRLPDDGEWQCMEQAGAVVCLGGGRAAGVAPGGDSLGYDCGPRSVKGAPTGERVCVDLSPDLPEGRVTCRFEADGGLLRICEPSSGAHVLGDACDAARPCVDGAVCITGRCAPRRPAPSCWLAGDCVKGSCRFGSCVEDAS